MATYNDLLSTCSKQQQIINDLNKKIADLEARFDNQPVNLNHASSSQTTNANWLLRQFPSSQQNLFTNISDEYHTDSDELDKEFPEINKKKRRRTATKTPPKKFSNSNESKKESVEKMTKVPLPPPINVSNVKNFDLFRQEILKVAKESTRFKAISNSDIKISVQNEEEYRKIKKLLEEMKNEKNHDNKVEYHTYQLKSDKCYRFVIRGLPSSISQEEIKMDLEKLGHDVTGITNIYKNIKIDNVKIRKTFPLFFIDLKQKENNKDVFNIKNLAHCVVKIEPPNKNKGIPQCTNCQQLGHTKSFCHRQTKCVKCAKNHHTTQCEKLPEVPPTCALFK